MLLKYSYISDKATKGEKSDTTEMRRFFNFLCWNLLVHTIYALPKQSKNSPVENMNGEYLISNPNNAEGKSFSTLYSTYPDVEYFDVYSPPISTKYESQ